MSARVKVDGGRYRNTDSFESDIGACLQPFIDQGERLSAIPDEAPATPQLEAEEREDEDESSAGDIAAAKELADHAMRLLSFFEEHLSPRLPTNRR